MIVQNLIILIILLLFPFNALSQNTPEKTLDFDGYVLSDSLEYRAETIDYFFDSHKFIMNKNANIKYMGRMLKSNTINYYQDFEYMEAVGEIDSSGADFTGDGSVSFDDLVVQVANWLCGTL